jgi:hypothetical protein
MPTPAALHLQKEASTLPRLVLNITLCLRLQLVPPGAFKGKVATSSVGRHVRKNEGAELDGKARERRAVARMGVMCRALVLHHL